MFIWENIKPTHPRSYVENIETKALLIKTEQLSFFDINTAVGLKL